MDHEEDHEVAREVDHEAQVASCEGQVDREARVDPSYREEDQTLWQEYSEVHAFVRAILGSASNVI